MKHLIAPLLFLLIATTSCAQKKLVASAAAVQVIDHYLNMKNSLIASDKPNINKSADTLVKAVAALQNSKGGAKIHAELDSLHKYAVAIAATDNINDQRNSFANLSTAAWQLAEKVSHPGEPLYLQVCPMTKVSWVSKEKEIRNPYFPKNMLTCGAVKGEN